MADQVKYVFAFLLVLHVSLVSCRPDYDQYFSQYIQDESTTESSLSSTGISTGKSENISIPEVPYSENVISLKANSYSSSNNDAYEKPVQSAYSTYNEDDMRSIQIIRWGFVVGCIVAVGLIICCIAVCCPQRLKGRTRPGFILSTNSPVQPMPNLPQASAVQYVPLGTEHPPLYSTQPIQHSPSETLMQQYPMDQQLKPMDQQQPLLPYGSSNPETVPPPYPTKY